MNKKRLTLGIILLVGFALVLVAIFMPWYGPGATGKPRNGLEFSDDFFNSLAKGSSNYMADMRRLSGSLTGKIVTMDLKFKDDNAAKRAQILLTQAGGTVEASGAALKVAGDLGQWVVACIDDSEAMFHNQGDKLQSKYQLDPKAALKTWWLIFQELDKDLKKQKLFQEAKIITEVTKRAIEPAYNFYGISPQPVRSNIGLLTFMLVFYVVYTLWYGYGVYEIFEGFGLGAEKGHKEEV